MVTTYDSSTPTQGDLPDATSSYPGLIEVKQDTELLALIVRCSYRENGIHFLTSNDLSQQLAFMRHPAGKEILPHVHNPVERRVTLTQESLFIRKGRLRVDFYNDGRRYLRSYELGAGDVILLIKGGHGFVVLEDAEFIEVKQGPYAGDRDKTRFEAVDRREVVVVR